MGNFQLLRVRGDRVWAWNFGFAFVSDLGPKRPVGLGCPVGFLVFGVAWEMSVGDFHVLTLLFGTGEEGWVNVFVTLPTISCCCYSVMLLSPHENTKLLPGTHENDDRSTA